MTPEEAGALVADAKNGDYRALARLAKEYHPELYRYCYARLKNPQDSEDAVQDTFEKAVGGLSGLRSAAAFRAWLYRIASNTCLTKLRTRGRWAPLDENEDEEAIILDPCPAPDDMLRATEIQSMVWHCLESLTDLQRAAVILFHLDGFTYDEISEVLNVPGGTARKRVFDGVNVLRQCLEKHRGTV